MILGRLAGLGLIERQEDGGVTPLPALGRYALRASHDLAETTDSEPLQFES